MDSEEFHRRVFAWELVILLSLTTLGYVFIPLSYLPDYPHHVFGICMSALGLLVLIIAHVSEVDKIPVGKRGTFFCTHFLTPIVVRIGTWAWATYIYAQKLDASDRELRSQVSWHNDVWLQVLLLRCCAGLLVGYVQRAFFHQARRYRCRISASFVPFFF